LRRARFVVHAHTRWSSTKIPLPEIGRKDVVHIDVYPAQ
jgi:hypothetical protein